MSHSQLSLSPHNAHPSPSLLRLLFIFIFPRFICSCRCTGACKGSWVNQPAKEARECAAGRRHSAATKGGRGGAGGGAVEQPAPRSCLARTNVASVFIFSSPWLAEHLLEPLAAHWCWLDLSAADSFLRAPATDTRLCWRAPLLLIQSAL